MEIRKWNVDIDGLISEPGIYDLPIRQYHSQCCDGPSVSSTGLRKIELETPLHFFDTWDGNPNRDPADKGELEADHFRIGRAAHWRTLEPERFAQEIAVRPDIWDSWRTKDSQAWLKDIQKMGLTILTPEEMVKVDGIKAALTANQMVKDGLLGGAVEASLITKDAKTGIWIKSRPDSVPHETAFSDLKCMQDVSPQSVARAVNTLGYDMQMALAGICYEKLTGITADQFYIIACESKRPHAIHIASLSTSAVYWARIRLRRALNTMAKCLADNDWPAYGADGQEVGPHPAAVERFEQDQKNALLPQDDDF